MPENLKSRHLVLVGINLRRERSTGDKNFWSDLLPLIAHAYEYISIFSIRKEPAEEEVYTIGKTTVKFNFLSPIFLESSDAEYNRPRIFWRHGAFPARLGAVEKVLSGIRLFRRLRKLYREKPYDRLHLMDNFGLFNQFFVMAAPADVSVSAMAYQGWDTPFYNRYLRLSYNHPAIQVVAYSAALGAKLRSIGITLPLIRHIHWGVALSAGWPSPEKRKFAKEELSIPPDMPILLWAGYIQQIRRDDFFLALRWARKARENGFKAVFYFAFKPESMEEEFIKYNDPDAGIFIKATSAEEFTLLKTAADVFYSPLVNKNCVVSPPLTWIELLSQGVPILTTDAGGTEEVVVEGKTGSLIRSEGDMERKMRSISKNSGHMAPDCYRLARDSFSIADSAARYLEFWRSGPVI